MCIVIILKYRNYIALVFYFLSFTESWQSIYHSNSIFIRMKIITRPFSSKLRNNIWYYLYYSKGNTNNIVISLISWQDWEWVYFPLQRCEFYFNLECISQVFIYVVFVMDTYIYLTNIFIKVFVLQTVGT